MQTIVPGTTRLEWNAHGGRRSRRRKAFEPGMRHPAEAEGCLTARMQLWMIRSFDARYAIRISFDATLRDLNGVQLHSFPTTVRN